MLRNRESIAGAVAREIDRIDRTGETHGEGAAYKAAWDRKGSSCFKHCAAFTADCDAMAAGAWRCSLCGFRGFWEGGPHCGPGSRGYRYPQPSFEGFVTARYPSLGVKVAA